MVLEMAAAQTVIFILLLFQMINALLLFRNFLKPLTQLMPIGFLVI